MSLKGINFNNRAGQVKYSLPALKLGQTSGVQVDTVVKSGTNTTTRKGLADDVRDISNRAKINSPAAQGLASADEIAKGQLVSGFHFDKLDCDTKLFALKYNSANTPSIAKGTTAACENIEYAGVVGNLQAAEDSPFAELFK